MHVHMCVHAHVCVVCACVFVIILVCVFLCLVYVIPITHSTQIHNTHVMSLSTQFSTAILVNSRIGLGFVGVLLVAVSVVAALGLLSFMNVKGTLIIIEVVPFLVLAVGTDNLFILTHAYEVRYINSFTIL